MTVPRLTDAMIGGMTNAMTVTRLTNGMTLSSRLTDCDDGTEIDGCNDWWND